MSHDHSQFNCSTIRRHRLNCNVFSEVGFKVGRFLERRKAHRALVGLFTRMSTFMLALQTLRDERLIAKVTLVRFVSGVGHLVTLPVRAVRKGHVAVSTRIGLLSGVHSHVVHHLGLNPERFVANFTLKR